MTRSHLHAQHFLRSPRLVAELVGHSNIRKNDTVYDLGAGSGLIASVLARRCKWVVAVENEPKALQTLRRNVGAVENIEILPNDILSLKIPYDRYKIFSNIPFSMSAEVVRKFVVLPNPPIALYLIVQKQFARKLVPGNDHFTSELAAEIGPLYTARIRKPLKRTDFTPPPGVDTVLLELKRREIPLVQNKDIALYRQWVAECFNNISYFRKQPLAAANISPERTPSQLTLEQWLQLWEHKKNHEARTP